MTEITPPDVRFGWLGPAAAKAAFAVLGDSFPRFVIVGATAADAGQRVVLWDFARRVNGGRHLPTLRQEIGDCVSMGATNAVNYLACMEIARLGERERYRPAFPPFIYGISRVQVGGGRLGNSDGSLGIWAADAVRKYGVLAGDEPGVPRYSGALAREWGHRPGPPEAFLGAAQPHCLKTTAPVGSYAEVRAALVNGYPVTVASMQGFQMMPRVERGKHWGIPAGQWSHQMSFIGVDDTGARPGCYCMNSWGPDAHGPPADDAPPGGFWVDAEIVDRMVRQGDSFAYSQFEGFPAQKLDFVVV